MSVRLYPLVLRAAFAGQEPISADITWKVDKTIYHNDRRKNSKQHSESPGSPDSTNSNNILIKIKCFTMWICCNNSNDTAAE